MTGSPTQAIAEITAGGEFIKITVFPTRAWKGGPGEYVFLYFPSTGRFWESHPFSIASWDNGEEDAITSPAPDSTAADPEKDLRIETNPVDSSFSSIDTRSQRPSITFLARSSKGITKSLQRQLQFERHGKIPIDVTMEGPYGHQANLQHVDRILCIGGGIGITALLAYVQYYTAARKSGTIKARRLVLAWSYRESELGDLVRQMLPKDAGLLGVDLMFKCTSNSDTLERLQVADVVEIEAQGIKRLAVIVCAPGGLADEVRREVVANIGGATVIDLHEDSFAW